MGIIPSSKMTIPEIMTRRTAHPYVIRYSEAP